MKSLKGTQTEKNILTAFAGESQARNRYDFFAAKAKSDGYVLVRDIFQETALQEKEHAKRLFKFLEGGDVEIVGAFPASSAPPKPTCWPPPPVKTTSTRKCILPSPLWPKRKVSPRSPL